MEMVFDHSLKNPLKFLFSDWRYAGRWVSGTGSLPTWTLQVIIPWVHMKKKEGVFRVASLWARARSDLPLELGSVCRAGLSSRVQILVLALFPASPSAE